MTPEQQAAYIQAQAASAMVEALGMISANLTAMQLGQATPHPAQDFNDLILRYGIHHNAVIGYFTGR